MSPAIIALSIAVAALIIIPVVAWFWINRAPKSKHEGARVLPLFTGSGMTIADDEPVESASNASSSDAASPPIDSAPVSIPNPVSIPTPRRVAATEQAPYAPPRPPPTILTFDTSRPFIVADDGSARASVERQIIQFNLPTEGTLQFLPGRLEIVSGQEHGREIRFVRLPGPNGTEFTFGRSEGEVYRHIQLSDQTVSRQHARMRFHEGRWYLLSLSHTNPVIHVGRALAVGEEQLLDDGDRIEMGEVLCTFRYR